MKIKLLRVYDTVGICLLVFFAIAYLVYQSLQNRMFLALSISSVLVAYFMAVLRAFAFRWKE